MAGKPAAPKNISSKTLLTVSRQEFNEGQKATEIRVVAWIIDSKTYPQLEKREMFMSETGWKSGKAKGFSRKDLELVQDQWAEIMAALGNKLPEAGNAPGKSESEKPAAVASAPASDF